MTKGHYSYGVFYVELDSKNDASLVADFSSLEEAVEERKKLSETCDSEHKYYVAPRFTR